MFERWCDRARQSVVLSHTEARGLGSDEVRPEHVLLGLARRQEGLVAGILAVSGVPYRRLYDCVAGGSASPQAVGAERIPFSSEVNEIFERAAGEARSTGHQRVGPVHILLALVADADSLAVRVLASCGTTADTVRERARRRLASTMADCFNEDRPVMAVVDSEASILPWALSGARRVGEFDPVLIQHTTGTRGAAADALGWGSDEEMLVYVVVMQGQFAIGREGRGRGRRARPATASIIQFLFRVIEVKTGRVVDSGGRGQLPDLSSIGPVVTDLDCRAERLG